VLETTAAKKDQRTRHPYDPKKNKGKGPGRPREFNRPPRYEFVMGLVDLIAIPNITPRLKAPAKVDKVLGPKPNAWCEFHQSFGHSLDSCLALGYQLDDLVKSGFLNDYLLDKRMGQASSSQPASSKGQQHEMPTHGEIHTIAGGFSGGGCTASQRKKYARSVMAVDVFEDHSPEEARESGITRAVIASETRPKPVEEWLEREIGGKVFKLGRSLEGEMQDQIAKVIERHLDAFAWSTSDMPGIDPDFLCDHLAMDTQVRPVRQRRRKFNEDRRQAIRDETQKLLAAGHIREIQYLEWLANVMLVKKSNGK